MSAPSVWDYRIGIVCALPKEVAAIAAILDDEHLPAPDFDGGNSDSNSYIFGRIHQHNVVVACLPAGVPGTNAAAFVASNLARTFRNVRLGLLVGIAGGIPNLPEQDVRLGDVVVSQPHGTWPGVVQFDMGKNLSAGRFQRTGSLNKAPISLLTALSSLQAEHFRNGTKVSMYMTEAIRKNPILAQNGYSFPGNSKDNLHCAYCNSSRWWWRFWLLFLSLVAWWRCEACVGGRVKRKKRHTEDPILHYGTIASSNTLVKDAVLRDQLRKEFSAKCVEMEAAGLLNNFPCIIVRGISDYADAYKNDDWQGYASLAAAAFGKELLFYVQLEKVEKEKPLGEVMGILEKQLDVSKDLLEETKQHNRNLDVRYHSERHQKCHLHFKTSTYEEFKNRNPKPAPGTCQWALNDEIYRRWKDSTSNDLLWISADPGCGKSVLARSLVDNGIELKNNLVCYFFFKDNELQDRVAIALSAVLHQLFSYEPGLIQYAIPAWEANSSKLSLEVDELWRILLNAVNHSPRLSVTCVFDALDECREDDRRKLIQLMTKFYKDTQKRCSTSSNVQHGQLKFLVTSRPYGNIQDDFYLPKNLPSIRLRGEDENEQIRREIDSVIELRVEDLATRLNLDAPVKARLRNGLLKMEHRTYLWLHLALDSISETFRDSLRPETESINYLPSSVDDAYEKILSKVSSNGGAKTYVTRTLQIIVGTRRPLTLQEMAIALGIATSPQVTMLNEMKIDTARLQERIRQLCGLFVCFINNRVSLIHQTAKEFLLRDQNHVLVHGGWKNCLDPVELDTVLARICVEYLLLDEVQEVENIYVSNVRQDPFGQCVNRFPAAGLLRYSLETIGPPTFEEHTIVLKTGYHRRP